MSLGPRDRLGLLSRGLTLGAAPPAAAALKGSGLANRRLALAAEGLEPRSPSTDEDFPSKTGMQNTVKASTIVWHSYACLASPGPRPGPAGGWRRARNPTTIDSAFPIRRPRE